MASLVLGDNVVQITSPPGKTFAWPMTGPKGADGTGGGSGTGNMTMVVWDGVSALPARPATTSPVFYISPISPSTGGTTAGGGNAVANLDKWLGP